MPLADFFGVEHGARLRPVRFVQFGGGPLPVRPLTLEQVFRLWDVLRPYVPAWVDMLTGKSESAEWMKEAFPLAFGVLYPEEPTDRYDAASGEEVGELYRALFELHDWTRILAGCLGITADGAKPAQDDGDTDAVNWLLTLEQIGGRKIEALLAMRAEAFLSYAEALGRLADKKREAVENARPDGSPRTGLRNATLSQLFDVFPGPTFNGGTN